MKQTNNSLISLVLDILKSEYSLKCEFKENQILLIGKGASKMEFGVTVFPSLSVKSAEFLTEGAGRMIVITKQIGNKVSEILRTKGMFFIDTAGNAFIRGEDFFIDVRGRKQRKMNNILPLEKLRLEKSGIKLLITFFSRPDTLNKNYRDIAALSGCSLGYVSKFVKKLRGAGYLVKDESGNFNIINRNELVQRLRIDYQTSLKHKYFIGRYKITGDVHYSNSDSGIYSIYYTSGKAFELKKGFLKEKITELYLEGELNDFIKTNHLIPDQSGNLIVFGKYWNFEHDAMKNKTAPDFIVYLDLITSANPRLMEAAGEFYAE